MTDAIAAELMPLLAQLNRWATANATFEVPVGQLRLMALIQVLGASRISDLARADHCTQPTMTAQVQRLEAAGWAVRRVDPHDARASLIDLTDRGRDAVEQARQQRIDVVAPILDQLSVADRERIREGLVGLRALATLIERHSR